MRFYLIIVLLLVLTNCSKSIPKALPTTDYVIWVKNPDSKLNITKNIGEYTYQLQYKPSPYIALLDQQRNQLIDTVQFNERISELQGTYQFNLSLSHQSYGNILNQGLGTEYFERLEYLTLKLKEDLELRLDDQKITCDFYHFERNYNLAPFVTVVFGFDLSSIDINFKKMQVIYNDQLLGAGPIVFSFSQATLTHIPELIL